MAAHDGHSIYHEKTYTGLSGEQMLIIAVLRQAVADARWVGPAVYTGAHQAREEALLWWHDQATVQWWLDLVGLPDTTYVRLLAEVEGA